MLIASLLVALSVPVHVEVEFVHQRVLPLEAVRVIVDEAHRIWSPYGVTLQERQTPEALSIVIVEEKRSSTAPSWAGPLGQIVFDHTGEPRSTILLFYDAAARLIGNATAAGSVGREFAILHRPNVIGRVLGRALAHELGHYLLRSPGHSVVGLMRAHQPITDLLADDLRRFALMPDEAARLRAVHALSDECGASGPCR